MSFPNSSMLKKISLPCEYIWLLNSELPAKRTAKCLRTVPRDQVDEGELQRTKRAGLQTPPDTGRGSRKRAPRWPTPGPASAGTSRQEKPGWIQMGTPPRLQLLVQHMHSLQLFFSAPFARRCRAGAQRWEQNGPNSALPGPRAASLGPADTGALGRKHPVVPR